MFEKIFGKDFDYLAKYYKKFLKKDMSLDQIRRNGLSDYPHNPYLSSLLYSGILGGLFYLYFTIYTFFLYWKQRKQLYLFFIFYIITFMFTLVSGNTMFTVPIFVILSLIPFIKKRILINSDDPDQNLIK